LYPDHEQQVAELARQVGFNNISVSSEIDTKIGFVARGQSATADAYLTPEVTRYLSGFSKGFKGRCAGRFPEVLGAKSDSLYVKHLVVPWLVIDEMQLDRQAVLSALRGPRTTPWRDHQSLGSTWVAR
jgi:hypothetical protein